MPITFVQSGSGSSSPNATTSVTISATAAMDLILTAFAVGDIDLADQDMSLSGYTEVADLAALGDTNDTQLWVGYKYSPGGETTVGPFTALGGNNASNAAVVMVFRGVAPAAQGGPFDTTANTATGENSSTPDPPSHNWSGESGVWTVAVGATGHTGGATGALAGPTNYTTNYVSRNHDDTTDVLVGMGYRENPADPEDPGTFTPSNIGTAANNSWCAVTMSLKPKVIKSLAAVGVG